MPSSALNPATPRAFVYARVLGYLIYFIAFFLPACRPAGIGSTGGAPDAYQGYFCAWITLINTLNKEVWLSKDFLAILSGWINPLLLFYVAFLFSPRKLRAARRVIALAIALFIVGTWIYFALAALVPLIGHVLWIAGILLILAGEAASAKPAPIPAGMPELPKP
jgi:hypothetical protein